MFESRRPEPMMEDDAATDLRLIIDNRPTAVWSLATWLALDFARLECDLVEVDLFAPDRRARLAELTPTGKVPVLVDHGTTVWETQAIMEAVAELAPALWPEDAQTRAVARSVVAELHSGLTELSEQLPADWFARYRLRSQLPARAQVEMYRLTQLLNELLGDKGNAAFLFGEQPVLADFAMVPMAGRLRTYGLMPKDKRARAYTERLLELEPLSRWFAGVEPVAALPTPPAIVAAAREPAAGPAKSTTASETQARGASPNAPDSGGRRLEDIVARARQRERTTEPTSVNEPLALPEVPDTAGPPSDPDTTHRADPPAADESSPSGPPLLMRRPSKSAPPRSETAKPAWSAEPPSEAARPGLPWLTRRRPPGGSNAPAGGSRRRPPPRD